MSGRAPVLVAFAGRSGVGKTTLAKALALASGAVYLRIDTVEQALRTALSGAPGASGYAMLQALAAENLDLGQDVIADGMNPVAASREGFAACAREAGARLMDVEIVCTDVAEHRSRVEARWADIAGLAPPDWAAVQARTYEPWTTPRIVLDTARQSVGQAVATLLVQMKG